MSHSVAHAAVDRPRMLPEIDRKPAKADLRKPENALAEVIGACIRNARNRCDWTKDRLAREVPHDDGTPRDPSQISRWESGKERAQFDVLFACHDDAFVGALYEELAVLSRRYETFVALRRVG